ncbi:PTS fructose transporter subunit IIB [Thermosediminibacter litoriperuensis]|uniref:PTS system IIB component, Fru family (TC 4.A.2) n=1 Tax=Thermosediminibacter litoriperuensis TaxID=291989 RepID=A0A5S5ASM8_9FIRM|nr:fructose PTS transporter subunit IIB [Thermosediminibacter litoriperuensis]TYP55441.1 PTS system IIB component, Fru family (TC 4.A.2) [Thermosediminibacter litoriperuensis]
MKIVAVTACPSGVAHTYMAATALKKAAKANGAEIKIETQGALGIENEITEKEAREADAVILAIETAIAKPERFKNKPVIQVPVSEAIKDADAIVKKAISLINK